MGMVEEDLWRWWGGGGILWGWWGLGRLGEGEIYEGGGGDNGGGSGRREFMGMVDGI